MTQAGVIGVTGKWNGTLSMPGANFTGCNAQTISFYLDLTEDSNSNVSGSTSNEKDDHPPAAEVVTRSRSP